MPVPIELRTPRFVLRPWRAADAADLLPVLEANWDHLGPWIPARVATPVPIPELATRLDGFGADFTASREWRYGMFSPDESTVLGEIGLYPRDATKRVAYPDASCVELGYWLRADATGQGLITDAARMLLDIAARLPRLTHVEVRCDARNAPSAAIPQRLGFVLTKTLDSESEQLQVWTRTLASRA